MNKQRRKAIENAITEIENVRSTINEDSREELTKDILDSLPGKIADVRSAIETAMDEEQEYYDNMPEGLQMGDKGDKAQEAIDSLDEACGTLEEVETYLEEAKGIEGKDEDKITERNDKLEEADTNMESVIDTLNTAIE